METLNAVTRLEIKMNAGFNMLNAQIHSLEWVILAIGVIISVSNLFRIK